MINRNQLDTGFHSQIAARYHHAIGGVDDFIQVIDGFSLFDLGDQRRRAAGGLNQLFRFGAISAAADKRQRKVIDGLLRGPLQIVAILFGQRRNGQSDAGQIDALALAENSAIDYPADDVGVGRAFNAQFDRAIVKQDARARMHIARHAGIVRRDLSVVAFDVASGDDELLVVFQLYRLMVLERAGANLRAGKIDQHGQRAVHFFGAGARHRDVLRLFFLRSVRHVDAHAVNAGGQQRFHYFRVARSRTNGG